MATPVVHGASTPGSTDIPTSAPPPAPPINVFGNSSISKGPVLVGTPCSGVICYVRESHEPPVSASSSSSTSDTDASTEDTDDRHPVTDLYTSFFPTLERSVQNMAEAIVAQALATGATTPSVPVVAQGLETPPLNRVLGIPFWFARFLPGMNGVLARSPQYYNSQGIPYDGLGRTVVGETAVTVSSEGPKVPLSMDVQDLQGRPLPATISLRIEGLKGIRLENFFKSVIFCFSSEGAKKRFQERTGMFEEGMQTRTPTLSFFPLLSEPEEQGFCINPGASLEIRQATAFEIVREIATKLPDSSAQELLVRVTASVRIEHEEKKEAKGIEGEEVKT